MSKKTILCIADVKTWGGWERAQMVQKYLSDEYDIDLMDQNEFKNYERRIGNFISKDQIDKYFLRHNKWQTKKHAYIPDIIKWKKGNNKAKKYNLIYLMFHTILAWQEVQRLMVDGHNFISVVTGSPVVKDVFNNGDSSDGLNYFKKLPNKSKGVLCNNMISLRELRSIYEGPTGYIPRGVDPDLFKNTRGYWNQGDEFTVGFVGKENSGKGLESIIKPACRDFRIKLMTNTRNYTNALSKEQMVDFYNQIHVLVVASTTDGTPNPALEAAACERPIVSVPIGNMPEFIKDGHNGFLVKRHSHIIGTKLQWLKDNRKVAEEMGVNARQTVLDGWTWEHSMNYERKALKNIFEKMDE
jgi:glycosyltransferase involved in cell wall biosynthesis